MFWVVRRWSGCGGGRSVPGLSVSLLSVAVWFSVRILRSARYSFTYLQCLVPLCMHAILFTLVTPILVVARWWWLLTTSEYPHLFSSLYQRHHPILVFVTVMSTVAS
jgi:hypothetical protein